MRKHQKIISYTLAIALCLMLPFSVSAVEYIDNTTDATAFISAVESKVAGVLSAVELQKEHFGLSDVDFSSMMLGNEIPSYEVTNNGLVRIDDIHYFPILNGSVWVATAVISYNAYGDMNVEVSTKYVDEYLELSGIDMPRSQGTSSDVALVFGSTEAYLYSNSNNILVEQYQEISDRRAITACTEPISPETVQLTAQRQIDVPSTTLNQTNRASKNSEDFVSLNITAITQPTDYTCWAASTAMLLNYRGESETVNSVVAAAGLNLYSYNSAANCAELIRSSYGYPCGTWGQAFGFYDSLPLDTLVLELYSLSSPLYAGFISDSSSVGHAVVVRGYFNLDTSVAMYYVDPADGYFKATSVPDNGAVTITYGGNSHGLAGAFAVYEGVD